MLSMLTGFLGGGGGTSISGASSSAGPSSATTGGLKFGNSGAQNQGLVWVVLAVVIVGGLVFIFKKK